MTWCLGFVHVIEFQKPVSTSGLRQVAKIWGGMIQEELRGRGLMVLGPEYALKLVFGSASKVGKSTGKMPWSVKRQRGTLREYGLV